MLGMSYANYNNGNLSVPLLEAADKGSLIISESSPAFKSYKSYLNSFNASHNNSNDPYNGKQRNLIPAAFNSAILLNRSNRK